MATVNTTFTIGSGATLCGYSDRMAYTVIAATPRTITLQRDKATLQTKMDFAVGGFCAHCTNNASQTYTYEADPAGQVIKAHWSAKRGAYFADGKKVIAGRREFYDYNF